MPAEITVNIIGLGSPQDRHRFDPAEVTVKDGDAVSWENKTTSDHTVTPDKGFEGKGLKGKDPIRPKEKYRETIKASASPIKYHCEIHPHMKGTINVTA